jgi:hypothetical protein
LLRQRVIREAKWGAAVACALLVVASLSFLGSWLLRFEWFESLFRIPHEEVLIPFWVAALSGPVVALAVASLWLLLAILPSIESSTAGFIAAHMVALGASWAVCAVVIPGLVGPFTLVPAIVVMLLPRLALRNLRPPTHRAA